MTSNCIENRIINIQKRIKQAAIQCQRDAAAITLLAVSKTRPVDDIQHAVDAGLRCFGENYLQDAIEKIHYFAALDLQWHFIGPIQSNKTNKIAQYFDWVHSIDRLSIAERLSRQRSLAQTPLNVCIQVNIDHASNKSGVAPEQTLALATQILQLPGLRLRGLMAVPDPLEDLELQRIPFRTLYEQQASIIAAGYPLDTLSMGMSGDLEAAVAEGSTLLRIGTDIFGLRDKN